MAHYGTGVGNNKLYCDLFRSLLSGHIFSDTHFSGNGAVRYPSSGGWCRRAFCVA